MHAVRGKSGKLIDFVLTAGQRGDAPQGEKLLEDFQPGEVGEIVADAAYDSNAIRRRAKQLNAKTCIKPNPRRKVKPRYNTATYKDRNRIERFFGRIKRCRRVATRYEKKAINFAGFIWLAALISDMIGMSILPGAISVLVCTHSHEQTQPFSRRKSSSECTGKSNLL